MARISSRGEIVETSGELPEVGSPAPDFSLRKADLTPVALSDYAGSRLVLKVCGWKVRGEPPHVRKFIVIAYPHTTNWDVPLTLAISLVFRLHVHWMGKSSLFRGP